VNPIGTILLADDNVHDIELTVAALHEFGIDKNVVVVRDGAEALDYLYRRAAFHDRVDNQPVLVLLDLKMPKVDGLEVLRQVKSDPALKTIPIVMLTSSPQEADVVRSYGLGANAYVVKPLDFQSFRHTVETIGRFWFLFNQSPRR
jgi:two-component system, response regulator